MEHVGLKAAGGSFSFFFHSRSLSFVEDLNSASSSYLVAKGGDLVSSKI